MGTGSFLNNLDFVWSERFHGWKFLRLEAVYLITISYTTSDKQGGCNWKVYHDGSGEQSRIFFGRSVFMGEKNLAIRGSIFDLIGIHTIHNPVGRDTVGPKKENKLELFCMTGRCTKFITPVTGRTGPKSTAARRVKSEGVQLFSQEYFRHTIGTT